MNDKITIDGQHGEWRQRTLQLAEARTPFTLVKFNYLEEFAFCRCYIEQDHGFKHEPEGALVHHFTPLTEFLKPTHNCPPGFVFSGSPEDPIACESVEAD